MRKKFRENILSVNIDKLVYVSEKYLTDKPSRAVLTSKKEPLPEYEKHQNEEGKLEKYFKDK